MLQSVAALLEQQLLHCWPAAVVPASDPLARPLQLFVVLSALPQHIEPSLCMLQDQLTLLRMTMLCQRLLPPAAAASVSTAQPTPAQPLLVAAEAQHWLAAGPPGAASYLLLQLLLYLLLAAGVFVPLFKGQTRLPAAWLPVPQLLL